MRSTATKKSRFAAVAAAAAIFALTLAGCSSSGGGSEKEKAEVGVRDNVIYLGASNTLSGAGAANCTPVTTGAKLYFDKVNSEGGVAGHNINIEVLDDAYEPARALANMRTFENEKLAVVGACGSATAAAVYKTLSTKGIPYLFPSNGVAEVVNPAQPGIFQIIPLYEDQAATLIRYGFNEDGPGSVFVVANPLGETETAIANAEKAAKDLGGSFTSSVVTALGTPDYTPVALQIKKAAPDYLVLSMGGSDVAKLVNVLIEQDAMPTKLILATTSGVTGAFLSSYNKAAADKVRMASAIRIPAAPDSECAQLLADTKFAVDPIAIRGCATGQAVVKAIEETKPLTRANLIKTIDGWKDKDISPGVAAPLTYSPTDHIGITQLFMVQPDGTEFKTVATCPYGETAADQGDCSPS